MLYEERKKCLSKKTKNKTKHFISENPKSKLGYAPNNFKLLQKHSKDTKETEEKVPRKSSERKKKVGEDKTDPDGKKNNRTKREKERERERKREWNLAQATKGSTFFSQKSSEEGESVFSG